MWSWCYLYHYVHVPIIKTSGMLYFNLGLSYLQEQNESAAAILKIKESMQEEAKRFEKDSASQEHPDYFLQ